MTSHDRFPAIEPAPAAAGPAAVVPPPSPALLAALANLAPVPPRRPVRSLFVVLFAGCAYPAWTVASSPLHPQPATGPVVWLMGHATLWFASFVVPLAAILVPVRGQVLPDGGRAIRFALLTAAMIFGIGLMRDSVPHPCLPAPLARSWLSCLLHGAKLAAPTIATGAFALRHAAQADGWRLGAALGLAAASLAGLTLHLACAPCFAPAGLPCGGFVVASAALGALAVRAANRPRYHRRVAGQERRAQSFEAPGNGPGAPRRRMGTVGWRLWRSLATCVRRR